MGGMGMMGGPAAEELFRGLFGAQAAPNANNNGNNNNNNATQAGQQAGQGGQAPEGRGPLPAQPRVTTRTGITVMPGPGGAGGFFGVGTGWVPRVGPNGERMANPFAGGAFGGPGLGAAGGNANGGGEAGNPGGGETGQARRIRALPRGGLFGGRLNGAPGLMVPHPHLQEQPQTPLPTAARRQPSDAQLLRMLSTGPLGGIFGTAGEFFFPFPLELS